MNLKNKKFSQGFGLVEIVVGAAVLSIALLGVSYYFQQALNVSQRTGHLVQAGFLMGEGVEVAKIFRDTSWGNISGLTVGAPYHLIWNGTMWATTTATTFTDGIFDRTLVVDNVSRDANDDVVSSGGTLDVGTKKVTVSVAWSEKGATTTQTVSTYLANLFN